MNIKDEGHQLDPKLEADVEERGEGVSTLDYLISLMGYAIGIGNLWRFPYLVGKFGGGAFLIAYVTCLVLVACPMYLLELGWGQDTRKSTMHCFRQIHPKSIGVGYATAVMLVYVLSYYNILLGYSIMYIFHSFTDPLPWTIEANPPHTLPEGTTSSEYFWEHEVLRKFNDDDLNAGLTSGTGGVVWHLAVALLIVWFIVFLALFKGLEASAKVSYVTVGMPVVLLIIMLLRAVTLDGAGDGIRFYIGKFDGDQLSNTDMWTAACGQILFSLSPGMGTAITLSSYTRPKEDVYKVNLMVTLCNSTFSIVGGFAVFSILGFMAHNSCTTPDMVCQTVDELASKSGMGLAFVTLAEGVSQFGAGANVFALLFFIMLLTLGLDSTFAWVETVNTYIKDAALSYNYHMSQEMVAFITSVFFFLMGLPYCTKIGPQLLDVIDHYSNHVLFVVCFSETLMLHLWGGWRRVVAGLRRATAGLPGFPPEGRPIPRYWGWAIYYAAKPITLLMIVLDFVNDVTERYGGYPDYLQIIGWFSYISCIICIPIGIMLGKPGPAHASFDHTADAELPLIHNRQTSPRLPRTRGFPETEPKTEGEVIMNGSSKGNFRHEQSNGHSNGYDRHYNPPTIPDNNPLHPEAPEPHINHFVSQRGQGVHDRQHDLQPMENFPHGAGCPLAMPRAAYNDDDVHSL